MANDACVDGMEHPPCPDCGDPVNIQIKHPMDGGKYAIFVHCGHYWTFPDGPEPEELVSGDIIQNEAGRTIRPVDTEMEQGDGDE